MSAVWMLGRSVIRRRARSVVVLIVIVGFVGAIVMASAAGARRSSTAFGRFDAFSRAADLEVLTGHGTTEAQLAKFQTTPGITQIARLNVFVLVPVALPDKLIAASIDGKLGNDLDRYQLVTGRRANPDVADEFTVSESFAKLLHLHVGSVLNTVSMAPAQFDTSLAGKDAGPPTGPRVALHVVGIVRLPLDLGDRGTVGGVIVLTPAFNRTYLNKIALFSPVLRVHVANAATDLAPVQRAAQQIFGNNGFASIRPTAADNKSANDAINVLALALWIFAAIAAVAGIVTIAVVMAREFSSTRVDEETLRALGLTRRERVGVGLPRALLVAVAGALLGAIGAVLASPLFPVGIARHADPSVGLHVDWTVLGAGMFAVAAVVMGIAWIATARATDAATRAAGVERHRKPAIADLAASAGFRPTMTNGLRMALQPGRGEGAVPLRSAFFGLVFGVAGLIAVLVFSASLRHVVDTPRLYGQTWDFELVDDATGASTVCPHTDFGLQRVPGVGAVTSICAQTSTINGRATSVWGLTALRGDIGPAVVAGRAPVGADEIALGATTMAALHVHIGATVTVRGPHASPRYRVVGQIVLSDLSDSDPQPLADGATLAETGFNRVLDTSNVTRYLVGRFSAGVDRTRVEKQINALPFSTSDTVVFATAPTYHPAVPAEITRLSDIEWFPATGAVLLAALALIAVGHALVTAVRRRRRDLALLKTLGFDRAQIRATVAWQATTLAVVGLVLGLPAGVLFGSLAWRAVAHQIGVTATPVVPWTLVLAIPVVLALVIGVSLIPGISAARIRPRVALASE